MDHAAKIKEQPAAAAAVAAPPQPPAAAAEAAAKKKPTSATTLLDAYEVECIRRELQRLVLKHNQNQRATAAAPPDAHGRSRRRHHDTHLRLERFVLEHSQDQSAAGRDSAAAQGPHHRSRHDIHRQHQRVTGSAAKKATSAKQVSPSPALPAPAPAAAGPKKKARRGTRLLGRHAVAICSGTVPVAGGAVTTASGRGRRAVAICSGGGGGAPVACSTVGLGSGRRRPPAGVYREVEKV